MHWVIHVTRDLYIRSAGAVIREQRERAGLTLSALADRIGWNRSRLHKYENNDLALSFEAIEELARGLGQPPLALVLECLRFRFPQLRDEKSKTAKLLRQLVEAL